MNHDVSVILRCFIMRVERLDTKDKILPAYSSETMRKFLGITAVQYDKIKIFLISNYNVSFITGAGSISESFEITSSGVVLGNYFDDSLLTLNLKSGDSALLDEISENITKLCGVKESTDNIRPILDHISECSDCRKKFSDILSHARPV